MPLISHRKRPSAQSLDVIASPHRRPEPMSSATAALSDIPSLPDRLASAADRRHTQLSKSARCLALLQLFSAQLH